MMKRIPVSCSEVCSFWVFGLRFYAVKMLYVGAGKNCLLRYFVLEAIGQNTFLM